MQGRLASSLALALALAGGAQGGERAESEQLARGRYLVQVGGCNDCHTPGYAESGGQLPEAQWFTGSPVGFSGPWGTTYAANLRLGAHSRSEAQWLQLARSPMRPPMPSPSLMAMSDSDLLAVYQFIRSLGPAGEAAPAYVPPGQAIGTAHIDFMPQPPTAGQEATP